MPQYIRNTLLNFFSFFLIAISLYIFISLISYDTSDSGFFNINSNESINNLGGPLGASIADFLFTLIGYGGYLVLLIGCVWSIQSLFFEDKYSSIVKALVRAASSIFLIICFSSIGNFYLSNNFGGIIGNSVLISLSGREFYIYVVYLFFLPSILFFLLYCNCLFLLLSVSLIALSMLFVTLSAYKITFPSTFLAALPIV